MKHFKFIIVFTLFFTGCCIIKHTDYYILTEFEQTLVSYNSFQDLNFVDEEGNTFIASSSPQENIFEVRYDERYGCDEIEFETITSTLRFDSQDLFLHILLEAAEPSFMEFEIQSNGTTVLNPICSLNDEIEIQEQFQDITIQGSEYQNVLVIQSCDSDSPISRIIYSTTNGIQFIEFESGKWWRLDI